MRLLEFWSSHRAELVRLASEHVYLVAISTLVAIAIGLPLGIFAARRPRAGRPIVAVANVVQTIPSLALLGFLIPIPFVGLGARAALVALILYALLPIVRTTAAGLSSVDPALREAGTALGMTKRQLLRLVELPLALPSIVAGIRVAAVVGVGTATIAAAIGAGGLGEYIFRGLSMVDPVVILAGAIPAAALALIVDGGLTAVERRLTPGSSRAARRRRRAPAGVIVVFVLAAAAVATASLLIARGSGRAVVRVGSKNFTEQLVLGEIVAGAIERWANVAVERRLNLGGTFICDRAVRAGEIDVYVEYTGTALTAIFKEEVARVPGVPKVPGVQGSQALPVFERVRQRYAAAGVTLAAPLGFDNTFAILVREAEGRRLGLKTIEDAAPHAPSWRAGFGYEFIERADGYRGLAQAYGLRFAEEPRVMDLALMYRALADGQVDLIAGDATNGLIAGLRLFMLEDNRHYFPPYEAAPVARTATLLAHPDVAAALARLAGAISADDMRAMNYAVDAQRRDPAAVAKEFLSRTFP
jgi:osmoprotectant transport system permease protein